MKKIICIVLIICMCYTTVSCSETPSEPTETTVPTVTPELTETPITELLSKIEYKIYAEKSWTELDSIDTGRTNYPNYYDDFFYFSFDYFNVDKLDEHTKTITLNGKEIVADYQQSISLTNFNLKPSGIIWDVYEATIDGHRCEFEVERNTSRLISFRDLDRNEYKGAKRINISEAEEIARDCLEQNFGKNILDGLEVRSSADKVKLEKEYYIVFEKIIGGIETDFHYSVYVDIFGNVVSFYNDYHPEFDESKYPVKDYPQLISAAKEKLLESVPQKYKVTGEPWLKRDVVTGVYYLCYSFSCEIHNDETSKTETYKMFFYINIF
ncbi:MAG: hypothetical protein E7675_01875 [Ruminococcaceae bacterium]|nr:hypothetical protein [Oscillospiraceae bacterium]